VFWAYIHSVVSGGELLVVVVLLVVVGVGLSSEAILSIILWRSIFARIPVRLLVFFLILLFKGTVFPGTRLINGVLSSSKSKSVASGSELYATDIIYFK